MSLEESILQIFDTEEPGICKTGLASCIRLVRYTLLVKSHHR